MKRKTIQTVVIITISLLFIVAIFFCAARFIFLSPSCYSDNNSLSERENYFIKKTVLEAVEDEFSIFGDNGKNIFVWVNSDFMQSVVKDDGEYIIRVQSQCMESYSDDCVYEIHMSEDFSVTFLGLDP